MTILILTVILTVISATIFMFFRYKGFEKQSFIFKLIASCGFVLIAILGFIKNQSNPLYSSLLIAALSLGLLGDVALGLKNILPNHKKYLVGSGIIFFLLGHLTYSVNYITQGGVPWWLFFVNIGIACLIMQIIRILKYKLSSLLTLVGYFYSYTITLMLISAVSYFFIFDGLAATLILIGGISFFVSDALISASYFKPDIDNSKVLNLIVHTTYYSAQILLALSALYVI